MKLTTAVPINPGEPKTDHNSRLFLAGSCFVENIGEKLDYYQLPNFRNPFGILYHPVAIENLIVKAAKNYSYSSEDIFFHNERWHCFEAHSALSDPSKKVFLERLNSRLDSTRQYLKKVSHVIFTLGTAWVFKGLESGVPVANCHKIPQKKFSKEISSVQEIQRSLEKSISLIKKLNPEAQIILTVSPVRHLKDGFIQNQRSKAHLISAIHNTLEGAAYPIHYFPSYEIVMDELRDYRFYGEDLIHLNNVGVNIIWSKFSDAWVSEKAFSIFQEIEQIRKGILHRPFNEKSEAHKAFLQKLYQKITYLQSRYPHISF